MLEIKPADFTDGLDVGCDLKKEYRMILRFVTWVI